MITVQETTQWRHPTPNHKYILSDDKRWMYGYIREGEHLPLLFSKRIGFDIRGRSFDVLIKTHDVSDAQINTWDIIGSRGDVYVVSRDIDNNYSCTCPAAKFKGVECKHILQARGKYESTANTVKSTSSNTKSK